MNGLLLGDASPSLRWRVLTELGDVEPDHPDAVACRDDIATSADVRRARSALLGLMAGNGGSETTRDVGYLLCRLVYLGYDGPELASAVEWIFDRQAADGSWRRRADEKDETASGAPAKPAKPAKRARRSKTPPARPPEESYRMITLLTAVPLRGVAAAGYATDPRAERAYEWLLSERLDDGAWPGSTKADLGLDGSWFGGTPEYRRLPRSPGCRSATMGAVACFALHPSRRTSDEARAALDHLLARETREEWSLGWEVSRLVGLERAGGAHTFYVTFDLAFLLDLASRCGASIEDRRVRDLVAFIESVRGPFGLWVHASHPQLSRWLTFDIEASLRRLERGDWVGNEEAASFRSPYYHYGQHR